MDNNTALEKKRQRLVYRKIRKEIPNSEKIRQSKQICKSIFLLPEFKLAQNILLYYPTQGEVDIIPLIEHCWKAKKNVFFPFIKKLEIGKAKTNKDLKDSLWGFKEPIEPALQVSGQEVPAHLDLIVIPGIAFDKRGYRIGYGTGWYDKFIGALKYKPLLVGVCFKEQLVRKIPIQIYDILMDKVVSTK